jgi:hypothetical protein
VGSSVVFCCGMGNRAHHPSFALSIARVKVMRHIAKIMLWKT